MYMHRYMPAYAWYSCSRGAPRLTITIALRLPAHMRGEVRGIRRPRGGRQAARHWCRALPGALIGASALISVVMVAHRPARTAEGRAEPLPTPMMPPADPPNAGEGITKVTCQTTKGNFSIVMHREWAPRGYDRFLELVEAGFFDNQLVYRAMPGFLVQFGVAADPAVQARWSDKRIPDDPQQNIPFKRGTVSFAGSGADSRSTHVFISLEPNGQGLGGEEHERPFGRIEDSAEQRVIESFFSGYGDLTSIQGELVRAGNAVATRYPLLDTIECCRYHTATSAVGSATPALSSVTSPGARRSTDKVWLQVQGGVGSVPIRLLQGPGGAPGAAARLMHLAARNTSGRLHRAEPHPPQGSNGPPYALVQFSLSDPSLAGLAHEGNTRISRGAVCLIGGSSDVFISLARHGEHESWSSSMTVVGHVPEDALRSQLEARVLALPKHTVKHRQFGTAMSMLDRDLPCSLRFSP